MANTVDDLETDFQCNKVDPGDLESGCCDVKCGDQQL